ncbi:uncharacterized protein LOC134188865 isoform X2 [Corticium candelabrum]|nr:uncharacterized protein LOC134188865 isoform X2 [Corticium candelabrum]
MRMWRMNQRTSLSLSKIDSQFKGIEKQVDSLFTTVDFLADDPSPQRFESEFKAVALHTTVLDETNKESMVVMDALGNNRPDTALQKISDHDCSIAACFTRMQVRETTVASDVYDKLDGIRGIQKDIELRLSQRSQLQELATHHCRLIDRLQTKVANLTLARKRKELKQIAANSEKEIKETKRKKEETVSDIEKLKQRDVSDVSQRYEAEESGNATHEKSPQTADISTSTRPIDPIAHKRLTTSFAHEHCKNEIIHPNNELPHHSTHGLHRHHTWPRTLDAFLLPHRRRPFVIRLRRIGHQPTLLHLGRYV